MLFSSLPFLFLFLPLFFGSYFLFRRRTHRNAVLLAFSLIFYAWGEPLYVLLMLFSIVCNYFFALGIAGALARDACRRAKSLMLAAAALNLLLILIFKYTGFLVGSFNALTGMEVPVPEIALPIGISFYTFQILSYVVDVYRGEVHAQRSLLYLGAYLCAFPQLIAGPVVRYATVAHELEDRTETLADFALGLRRFIAGLAKKVLIANTMAAAADGILAFPAADYGITGAWLAMLSYALQIYFDFSGYSDMAIGMGRMMGFRYLENFNYPYIARSVTDFWRRWHISLSSFFRDYVYIPLGGSRVSRPRWIRNMMIVWACTGLWHGASVNFILWGMYFGILLILEKLLWGRAVEKRPILGHIYTLACVLFGWVIFRAETPVQLTEILRALCGLYGFGGANVHPALVLQRADVSLLFFITLAVACLLSTPIWQVCKKAIGSKPFLCDAATCTALLLCICDLAIGSYNPFIYFRF